MNWAELLHLSTHHEAVLSICAVADEAEGWKLLHGALLFVPPECARTSWQAWTGEVGAHRGEPIPSTFWIQRDGCLLGRAPMTRAQAIDWLDELDRQMSSTDGSMFLPEWPEASGRVRAALSPLRQMAPPGRVMPSTDDSNSRFILSLDRPTRGFLWTAERDERTFYMPSSIESDGWWSAYPARDLVGIFTDTSNSGDPLPQGIFVGTTDLRGWIAGARATDDWQGVLVTLGWDRQHVDPAGIIVEHEQLVNGQRVVTTRLALDDLDHIERLPSGGTFVFLSLGRRISHGFTLYAETGEVLDRSGPYPFVEAAVISMSVNGGPYSESTVAGKRNPTLPEFGERVERAAEIESITNAVATERAARRHITDARLGRAHFASELLRAQGELRVMDPFFGQDPADWRLLDGVQVPVRVVTSKIADEAPLIAPHVDAKVRSKAKIHDRVYLWRHGGLRLGGSPSTFGSKPVGVERIAPQNRRHWEIEFAKQWDDPHFKPLTRAEGPLPAPLARVEPLPDASDADDGDTT